MRRRAHNARAHWLHFYDCWVECFQGQPWFTFAWVSWVAFDTYLCFFPPTW